MERRAERDSKEDDGQMASQHNDDEERKSQQWPTTQWRVTFASSADWRNSTQKSHLQPRESRGWRVHVQLVTRVRHVSWELALVVNIFSWTPSWFTQLGIICIVVVASSVTWRPNIVSSRSELNWEKISTRWTSSLDNFKPFIPWKVLRWLYCYLF